MYNWNIPKMLLVLFVMASFIQGVNADVIFEDDMASLSGLVHNYPGDPISSSEGTIEVELYDEGGGLVNTSLFTYRGGEEATNFTFWNIPYGEYSLSVHNVPHNDLQLREYWGSEEVIVDEEWPFVELCRDSKQISTGDFIFVYQRYLDLTNLRTDWHPVVSLRKYVNDDPTTALIKEIPVVRDECHEFVLASAIGGDYGLYYAYDGVHAPTQYVCIVEPSISIDVVNALDHTISLDGKTIGDETPVTFRLDTPYVGTYYRDADGDPARITVEITTPSGEKTTFFGGCVLSNIPLELSEHYTDTDPGMPGPCNLEGYESGMYHAQAVWEYPAAFSDYAERSNIVIFTLFTSLPPPPPTTNPDSTPPLTECVLTGTIGENGWWVSDVEAALLATDDLSAVDKIEYCTDVTMWATYGQPLIFGEGLHNFAYKSTDTAGNTEPVQSESINIDTTAPVTEVTIKGIPGESDWFVSEVLVTLEATDNLSGVDRTEYRIGSGDWISYTEPVRLGEGVHEFAYRSIDEAGNIEIPDFKLSTGSDWPGTFEYITIDLDVDTDTDSTHLSWAPCGGSFSGSSSGSGSYYPGGWYTYPHFGSGGSGYYRWYSSSGSSGWVPQTDNFIPMEFEEEGRYVVEYKVTYDDGSVDVKTFTILVDWTPPETEIILDGVQNDDGVWISGIKVSFEVYDELSGPYQTIFSIDGGQWYLYQRPFSLSDGSHEIRYRSRDRAGNIEAEKKSSCNIEIVLLPELVISDIWCDTENPESGDGVHILCTVTNLGGSTAPGFGNTMYIDGELWDVSECESLAAGESQELLFTRIWNPEAGDYTIRVVADPENSVTEMNDENNQCSKPIRVGSGSDPIETSFILCSFSESSTHSPVYGTPDDPLYVIVRDGTTNVILDNVQSGTEIAGDGYTMIITDGYDYCLIEVPASSAYRVIARQPTSSLQSDVRTTPIIATEETYHLEVSLSENENSAINPDLIDFIDNSNTFYEGYGKYWFNGTFWKAKANSQISESLASLTESYMKSPVDSMTACFVQVYAFLPGLSQYYEAKTLIEMAEFYLGVSNAVAYNQNYLSINNIEGMTDFIEDLESLSLNGEEIILATNNGNTELLQQLLEERRAVLEDLYVALRCCDDSYMNYIRHVYVYAPLCEDYYSYQMVKSEILGLHLQFHQDYIYTTYELNRLSGVGVNDRLDEIAPAGIIRPTRYDSNDRSVFIGYFDGPTEFEHYSVSNSPNEEGEYGELHISLVNSPSGILMFIPGFNNAQKEFTISDFSDKTYDVYVYANDDPGIYELHAWIEYPSGFIGDIFFPDSEPADCICIIAQCPVDLIVTSPDGQVICKEFSEIEGAVYEEGDFNGDGDLDDRIILPPRSEGTYTIQVIPEPGANPDDEFTLLTTYGKTTLTLAKDVSVGSIATEPYSVAVTQTNTGNLVISLSNPTIPVPEFPSVLFPSLALIGLLLFVLFVQIRKI